MASSIQFLRSTTARERPFAGNLLEGQPALNLQAGEPGLFFKTTDGSIVKIGPVAITSDGAPPNSSPQGSAGNSVGEMWLDKALNPPVLKIFDGANWVEAGSGGGGGGGSALFVRWTYTAIGGETSLSGSSGGVVLQYQSGMEQVFVNGALLVRGQDYAATTGSSITNLQPLTAGDTITVISDVPVSTVYLPGLVTLLRWTVTATAGQTVFSGNDSSSQLLTYTPGFEQVFVNGGFLRRGIDYTATDSTSVTLNVASVLDDEVTVLAFSEFQVGSVSSANLQDGAVTSAKILDGTIVDADVSESAAIQSSKLSFQRSSSGAADRAVLSKLGDVWNVVDFGAVGNDSTDNTSAYTAIVEAAPAGATIYWPPGTYIGNFYSTKPFKLVGAPGVTLKPFLTTPVIFFEGSVGAAQSLSTLPVYGDTTLSGATGLARGDIAIVDSGQVYGSAPVNEEIVRMYDSTTVEGIILSTQTGPTPQVRKITPVDGPEVHNFKIDGGTSTAIGVLIRAAYNAVVTDIWMDRGARDTLRFDRCHTFRGENINRSHPTQTTSGYGYHILVYRGTNFSLRDITAVAVRRAVDLEQAYLGDIQNVVSQNCESSDISPAHNGFGGHQTYRTIRIYGSKGSYAINTNLQGFSAADYTAQVCRNITIEDAEIEFDSVFNNIGIYFPYQTENIQIRNLKLSRKQFAAPGNTIGLRFSGPTFGNNVVENCSFKNFYWAMFLDNGGSTFTNGNSSNWLTFRDVRMENGYVCLYDSLPASYVQNLRLENVNFPASSTFANDLQAYLWISNAHSGRISFDLKDIPDNVIDQIGPKIVRNLNNKTSVVLNNMTGSRLSASLTPASSTLTQGQMISAGGGRILQASTITTVEKPCGEGQRALFLCNGAVSINDASTIVGGPITATANQTIELISNGAQWRKVNTPGTW